MEEKEARAARSEEGRDICSSRRVGVDVFEIPLFRKLDYRVQFK